MKRSGAGGPLLLVVAAAIATAALAPGTARASGCCMSATAVGIGRLLSWERAAFGVQTSLITTLGFYGSDGRWHGAGAADDYQWRSDVWALVDLTHHLSAWADLPLALNYRRAGDLGGGYGGGLGDLQAGLRWDVLPVAGFGGRPGLAITTALTAPTGSTPADALAGGDARGATVTGRGAWMISLGAVAERATDRWFLRGGVTVNVPLPGRAVEGGPWQRFGPGLAASLVAGGRVSDDAVLSGYARLTWESELVSGGVAQPGTTILDPSAGLALALRVADHVTLTASLESNLFVDLLGRNSPGRVSAAIGARYGLF